MDFKELKERFMTECNLEPKLFTSTFSSMFQEEIGKKRKKRDQEISKQVNDILKNQMYNSLKKEKKIKKNNIKLKKKNTEDSYNNEKTTQINSTIGDFDFKKSSSIVTGVNYSLIKKFNPKFINKYEIILKKENGKSKKKMIKLLLFNNYIFYFITFNNNNFLFKKIIPTVNLFLYKKKIDDLTHMKLISQAHNTTIIKDFSCDDYEKVFNFCLRFNSINYQRDITHEYFFKYEIDQGKFGHVFLARSNTENKKYAIKLVQKNNQSFEEYKINRNEIDIFRLLQNINHPNIVKCKDLFENESQIFYVFEYLPCGNLKKYIQDLKLLPSDYNTDTVLKLIFQLIEGIYILHKYGIIHRDIKTTNLMVQINSPLKKSINSNLLGINDLQNIYEDMSDVTLKIIDFGLSKILGINETANEPYGSLSYKAPELILHKDYNFKVDVWSMGITIYYIVYKALPFDEGSREEIKKAIINNPVPFYANNILFDTFYFKNNINKNNIKDNKSAIIYSILKDCLIKKPEKRYGIEELYYKYCNFL
jgi:tRNA A-37 threonylcarbamoyl transferase component Bud32